MFDQVTHSLGYLGAEASLWLEIRNVDSNWNEISIVQNKRQYTKYVQQTTYTMFWFDLLVELTIKPI